MRSSARTPTGLDPDLWIVADALVRCGELGTIALEECTRRHRRALSEPGHASPRICFQTDAGLGRPHIMFWSCPIPVRALLKGYQLYR
jgi:hypothetical protein